MGTTHPEPSDFILVARLAHLGSGALRQVGQVRLLAAGSPGEGAASGVTTGAPPPSLAHLAHPGRRLARVTTGAPLPPEPGAPGAPGPAPPV